MWFDLSMAPLIHIGIIYDFNRDFLKFHSLFLSPIFFYDAPIDTSDTTHGFPWTIKATIAFCPWNFLSWERRCLWEDCKCLTCLYLSHGWSMFVCLTQTGLKDADITWSNMSFCLPTIAHCSHFLAIFLIFMHSLSHVTLLFYVLRLVFSSLLSF